MLKDVRIHMSDKSHFHFMECELTHIPDHADPQFIRVTCRYFSVDLPYHSIDCVTPEWTKGLKK